MVAMSTVGLPAPGPMRADARRNRELLLAAALEAFTERGADDTSLEEIARRAGVGIGTLYRHFPGRTALLEAVIADKLRRVEADLKSVTDGAPMPFSQRLHAMLDCMRRQTEEIQPAFVRDVQREVPELFALVRDGRRKLIQRYFEQLARPAGKGE